MAKGLAAVGIDRLPRNQFIAHSLVVAAKGDGKDAVFSNPPEASDKPTGVWDEHGIPLPWVLLDQLYAAIDKSYRPRRIDGRGLLVRTEASSARAYDETMGWNGLFARGLEIGSIVGDHDGIYREEVPALARQITDAANRKPGNPVRTLLCCFLTGLVVADVG